VRETPFFFRLGEHQLFAMLHRPDSGTPRQGIVLCHALAEEKLWSHRVYVNLARDLARAGFATLRFDCRGEGDSDLEFEQCGLETRRADALRAAEVLLEQEPQLRGCVFLGHRLGCAVAAMAAASPAARAEAVVAWDPVVRGRDYLMQLLRSTVASAFARSGSAPTRAQLLESLDAGETVIVDGYGITPAFHRELATLEWAQLAGALPCPLLAIEGAREAAFWRESKRMHGRAPQMSAQTLGWLNARAVVQ
jgi:alpha/beta superfamily hydrolase